MNRTKKFFYNSITTAVYQVTVMLVGFIIPRIMLKYYGSEVNGLISSVSQFIAYFNLVEAGLAGAAIYSLYKPLADKNHKEINAIVSAAKHFYTQSGFMFISLTLGLAIIYPFFVKSSALSPISIGLLVMILGINGSLEFFTLAKYRVLLSADQKTYVISLASIIEIMLNTAIITILSLLKVNIVLLRFVALSAIFLRSIILMIYVKRKYKYVNYNVEPKTEALDKRWDVLYLQVLGSTQTAVPVFLVTAFASLKTVSIYSIYNMVIGGLNGVLSIFISGLSASFGDVIARGEKKTLQKTYSEFEFSYYSLITVVYSVAMITIMPFIKVYTKGVTDINYYLPTVGALFVLNGWLSNVKTPQGMLVISAGMYKETKIQSTIQALIIIVVGIVLTPKYGVIGILISLCLSNLYRIIDLILFVPKNITKLPAKKTIFRVLRMILEIFIILAPASYFKIEVSNLIIWFIFSIIAVVYAFGVVVIVSIIFERETMMEVFFRFKSIIKNKEGIK